MNRTPVPVWITLAEALQIERRCTTVKVLSAWIRRWNRRKENAQHQIETRRGMVEETSLRAAQKLDAERYSSQENKRKERQRFLLQQRGARA